MIISMGRNTEVALIQRRDTGTLTWGSPALMLFARSALALAAQALVAGIFALTSFPPETPTTRASTIQ